MKKLIRKILIVVTVFCFNDLHAQSLKPGDMVAGAFESSFKMIYNSNLFVAQVNSSSKSENEHRFNFVHSNNEYVFEDIQPNDDDSMYKAKVKSSSKGAFKPGSWFYFYVFTATDKCDDFYKVKFSDGKVYLAKRELKGADYLFRFVHSGSSYIISTDGLIIKSGGSYPKGQKVTTEYMEQTN